MYDAHWDLSRIKSMDMDYIRTSLGELRKNKSMTCNSTAFALSFQFLLLLPNWNIDCVGLNLKQCTSVHVHNELDIKKIVNNINYEFEMVYCKNDVI